MEVTYVDHMGSDLSVVNAARVSFSKESDWDYSACPDWHVPPELKKEYRKLSDRDVSLIKYLAKHDHWTPFGHTSITLHFKAPIFVARQLGKHQVGFVWNEVSRRYVDDIPEIYIPEYFRASAENVKQGSSDKPVYNNEDFVYEYKELCIQLVDQYLYMIREGVAPEQARMILPQSMYTEWYWTGSLAAYSRVYGLRIDPHTQKETRDIAKQIGEIMEDLYPVSWEALTK